MKLPKITPLLLVEAIEPCLEFWVGGEIFVRDPGGAVVGFAQRTGA